MTPVTRFQVLGERSSGTNFAKRLLGRNSGLRPTEELGWKHGFTQAMAIPADLAIVGLIRNAADWSLSMHARPWHAAPEMQRLEFADFIRAPWTSIIDRPRYFRDAAQLIGQPLQQDRDPVTGNRFANLYALRRAKIAALLGHLNRDCTCIILRMEDLQADPEKQLDFLLSGLAQPPRETPFRPVYKRLGSKFKPAIATRPDTPARLSPDDLRFLKSNVDQDQEDMLGYHYDAA